MEMEEIGLGLLGNCFVNYMLQRRRCCAFDSPGLPNDSAGYPGLAYGLREPTPSVLRFLSAIRHKRFHYKRAFKEKAQHLRR
ncbi:lipopolysaccharide modification acyltransferase [Segatella salivae]